MTFDSRLGRPAALVDRAHQVEQDFLALAAHDDVDPGRLGEHLLEHEGAMDAAQHGDVAGTSLAIFSRRSAL